MSNLDASPATALAEWAPSEDATYLAYAIQEAGTDWRRIRVLEIDSGTILDDEVKWTRFTSNGPVFSC